MDGSSVSWFRIVRLGVAVVCSCGPMELDTYPWRRDGARRADGFSVYRNWSDVGLFDDGCRTLKVVPIELLRAAWLCCSTEVSMFVLDKLPLPPLFVGMSKWLRRLRPLSVRATIEYLNGEVRPPASRTETGGETLWLSNTLLLEISFSLSNECILFNL